MHIDPDIFSGALRSPAATTLIAIRFCSWQELQESNNVVIRTKLAIFT